MRLCGLAVFADRCFEGYKGARPVRLLDLRAADAGNLLSRLKEAFEIARYLEDLYAQRIRPGIKESESVPPDPESFQYGYLLPTLMEQAGSLMVWEDLRHTALEPALSEGIARLAGVSEEVKKVGMMGGCEVVVLQLPAGDDEHVQRDFRRV